MQILNRLFKESVVENDRAGVRVFDSESFLGRVRELVGDTPAPLGANLEARALSGASQGPSKQENFIKKALNKDEAKLFLENLNGAKIPKKLDIEGFLKELESVENKENFISHLSKKEDAQSRLAYLNLVEPTLKEADLILRNGKRQDYIKKFNDGKDFFTLLITEENGKRLITFLPKTREDFIKNKIDNASLIQSFTSRASKQGNGLANESITQPLFKSKEAREFLELVEGFHKLYKNDASIAKNLVQGTSEKLSTSIATSAEGAIKQKVVKGAFDPIFRLLPDKILFGLFAKQIQGGALRYHLKKALSRSLNYDDFKIKLEKELKRTNFNSNTSRLIDEFMQNLEDFNREKEQFLEAKRIEQARIKEEERKRAEEIYKRQEEIYQAQEANNLKDILEPSSLKEDFGENFAGYKGKEAVDKLLSEKRGQVKGAFYKEGLGEIDLVWGDKNYGLEHILNKHGGEFKNLARELSEAVENGKIVKDDKGRLRLEYENKIVGIKDNWKGEKTAHWVVTAYVKKEKEASLYTSASFTKGEALPLNSNESIAQKALNLHEKLYLKDNDTPLNVEYKIVNKDDIKPSFTLSKTQFRSQKQEDLIKKIKENFNPDLLVNIRGDLKKGNPIITKEGEVISGNHRAAALKELEGENLSKYQNAVKEAFGVELKENEMLVRVADTSEAEIRRFSAASNEGLENNLGEQGVSLFAKYQDKIKALKEAKKPFVADDVYNLKYLVNKALGESSITKENDTSKALFASLARGRNNTILKALNELEKENLEQVSKVANMFFDNAGAFYNLTHDLDLPKMQNLQNYFSDVLVSAAKADFTRAEDFARLNEDIRAFLDSGDKNAMFKLSPNLVSDLLAKAMGAGFARFARLENPSASLYEFLNGLKAELIEKGMPDLFSGGKGIKLNERDEFDFAKELILKGQDSEEKFRLYQNLEELKAWSGEQKNTKLNTALKALDEVDESKLSEDQKELLRLFKGEIKSVKIQIKDLKDIYTLNQGSRKEGAKKILIKHYGEEKTGGLSSDELLSLKEVIKKGKINLNSLEIKDDFLRYGYDYEKDGVKLRVVIDEFKDGKKVFDYYSDRNFNHYEQGGYKPDLPTPSEIIPQNAKSESEKEVLERQIPFIEAEIQKYEAKIASLDERIKKTQTRIQPYLDEINALQKQYDELYFTETRGEEANAKKWLKLEEIKAKQEELRKPYNDALFKFVFPHQRLKGKVQTEIQKLKFGLQDRALRLEEIQNEALNTSKAQKAWLEAFGLKSLEEAYIPNFKAEVKEAINRVLGGEEIKLTKGSLIKLIKEKRLKYLDRIKLTLENPHSVILQNDGALIFARDYGEEKYFTSVARNDNGEWIIRSNAPKSKNGLNNKILNGGKEIYNDQAASQINASNPYDDIANSNIKLDNESIAQNSHYLELVKEYGEENAKRIIKQKILSENIAQVLENEEEKFIYKKGDREFEFKIKDAMQQFEMQYDELNLKSDLNKSFLKALNKLKIGYEVLENEPVRIRYFKQEAKERKPKETKPSANKTLGQIQKDMSARLKELKAQAKENYVRYKNEDKALQKELTNTKDLFKAFEKEFNETEGTILISRAKRRKNDAEGKVETSVFLGNELALRNALDRWERYSGYSEENALEVKERLELLRSYVKRLEKHREDIKAKREQLEQDYQQNEAARSKEMGVIGNYNILSNLKGVSENELYEPFLEKIHGFLSKADFYERHLPFAREEFQKLFNLTPLKEFGTNYAEFYRDGKGAVEKLLKEAEDFKQRGEKGEFKGQVAGAFYKEGLGDIDLVWGEAGSGKSDGFGLAKIVKYHPEVIDKLDDIIANTSIVKESDNRYHLENENYKLAIRKDFEGEKTNWLLTAFEKKDSIARRRTDLPSTQSEAEKTTSANANEIIPQEIEQAEIKKLLEEYGEQISSNYPQETARLILEQNKNDGIVLSGFKIKGKSYDPEIEAMQFKTKKAEREFESLMKSYDIKGDFLNFKEAYSFKPNDEAFLQYLAKYEGDENAKLALAYNLAKQLIMRRGGGRAEVYTTDFLRQMHILENQNSTTLHSNPHLGAGLVGGVLNGVEQDENGNLSFDPVKFAMGFLGGSVGSFALKKGFQILEKNPELKEKIINELAHTLAQGFEKAREKYSLLNLLEPRYIVQNEKGRKIQAKTMLKELEREQKGLYNVSFNGKNAVLIKKDLEAVDEAILFEKGTKRKGGKHIRLAHSTEPSQEGYVTKQEVANLGVNIREYLKNYEPFIDKNGARLYEWKDENGVKFRAVVNNTQTSGGNSHLPSASEEIITFYSDRNLKEKMNFKNPLLKDTIAQASMQGEALSKELESKTLDLKISKEKDFFKNLRNKAKNILKNLKGKVVENENNALKASISSEGINKMISVKAVDKSIKNGFSKEEHFISVENVLNLFKISQFVRSEKANNGSADIINYHKFNADFSINKKPTRAKITIKESYEGGNKIYSLELLELQRASK
ncbi:PBECR2 nuclease fold domain-containing protein [Campylobacter upsaliensis]